MDCIDSLQGLPPAILEDLKKTAERTQTRQLRRIQQLKKQAESKQQRELECLQKEQRELERARLKQMEHELETLYRAQKRERVEARRNEIQKEKDRQRLENFDRLQEKLCEAEQRTMRQTLQKRDLFDQDRELYMVRQQRRDVIKDHSDRLIEEKRNEMLRKHFHLEDKLRKRQELKEYERKLKECQKQLIDEQRRKHAQKKAQAVEDERRLNFLMKQEYKELSLERMKQEKEEKLLAKSEKSKDYEIAVRSRLQRKQEEEELKREDKILSIQDKMLRADRVERQRDLVRDALSSVRREMSLQEDAVKSKLAALLEVDLEDCRAHTTSKLTSSLSRVKQRPKTSRGRMESLQSEKSLVVSGFDRLGVSRPLSATGRSPGVGSDTLSSCFSELDTVGSEELREIDVQAQRFKQEIDEELSREFTRRQQLQQVGDEETLEKLEDAFSAERRRMIKRLEYLSEEHHRHTLLTH